MHESTISRVTTNKYVETPQGLFELKFFFHSGIASGNGEMVSSVSVKKMIQDLLANEDPAKPCPTRRSPRPSRAAASPSRGARWPSTARSSASCPPTSAAWRRRGGDRPRLHEGEAVMQLIISGRGVVLTPAFKDVVTGKVAKLSPSAQPDRGPRHLHGREVSPHRPADPGHQAAGVLEHRHRR